MLSNHPISFYGVYIFDTNGEIVFSERFKFVESRIQNQNIKPPNNQELAQFFKATIIPYVNASSATSNPCIPLDFEISEGIHLVSLVLKNFYLAVIPHIQYPSQPMQPIIEVSASYYTLSLLDAITRNTLKSLTTNLTPSSFSPIRQLIIQTMPFGTLSINDPSFASMIVTNGDMRRFSGGYQIMSGIPVPSWKTSLLFPRAQLDIKLKEVVFGSIVGQPQNEGENNPNLDIYDIYGEIKCAASIQYLPDITAVINGLEKAESLSSHFCVKSIEKNQIVFSPPTGISQLLLYKIKLTPEMRRPPADGVYRIKEDENGLTLSLTITCHAPIKVVAVQLPFPDRGNCVSKQFQPCAGQLRMSKKSTVMWTIPLAEEETQVLSGTLNFDVKTRPNAEKYCAYISFQDKKNTYSGISLTNESITSTASSNYNITIDTSYTTETKKYIFWETPFTD